MAKPPKFFYHNDGSFLLYCAPPMSPEEFVYEAVGRFIGTQVDAVVCHQFGFGDAVPLWPTEVPGAKGIDMETVGYVSEWRQQEIMLRLWAEGVDPWQLALEAAHEAGMEYWIANRFNDLHGSRYQWKSEWRGQPSRVRAGRQGGLPHAPLRQAKYRSELRDSGGARPSSGPGGGGVHALRHGRVRVGLHPPPRLPLSQHG